MRRRVSHSLARPFSSVLAVAFALLPVSPSPGQQATSTRSGLSSPTRLAAAGPGRLLVTDYHEQTVSLLSNANLKVIRRFSVKGRPLGVAWANRHIYVGNESTGAVEVYTIKGRWLYDLGAAKGLIKVPNDIALDRARDRVFVVDAQEKNVKVFDLKGNALATIAGTGAGQLVSPTAIALDRERGELVVSDYGNSASSYPAWIRIYDHTGNYLRGIAGKTGGFSRPQGVAVEGGFIFVADAMLGQILVFDRLSGASVRSLGSFGTDPGQLMLPLDVVVDPSSQDVFVTNNRAERVEIFRGGGITR